MNNPIPGVETKREKVARVQKGGHMKIVNSTFQPGEVYRGRVNDILFQATEIRQPGLYQTKSGGIYCVRRPIVTFLCHENGKTYEVDFATAQRLMLDRVN